MENEARPPSWKILLAFAMIYFVWGSTFLAIRVGVHEVPPFLLAAVRFFTAGLVLVCMVAGKGTPARPREWISASGSVRSSSCSTTAACFGPNSASLPDSRPSCWLPSRYSSRLMEIIFLRTQKLTVRLGLALLVGIFGVAVLVNRSFSLGEAPIDRAGAIALLVASATWSMATILTRRVPLPASKAMSAAAQMLTGGALCSCLRSGVRRVQGFSTRRRFRARVVCARLPHHRRLDYWIHCLRMATAL